MPVAFPASAARRMDIAVEDLVHLSPARFRDQIVQSGAGDLPDHANARIHLKAGQGWSVLPFRLLRDYSILDPYLTTLNDCGCYTYFFVGRPGL